MTNVRRVAILGAESTGKSTLAEALATHYDTVWVPEYLREFVETHGRTPRADEQFHIAATQVAREEAAQAQLQDGLLFCDTTPLMTAVYSYHYFTAPNAELAALAASRCYNFTLVAAPTNPWVGDGLMRDGDTVRQTVHRLLIAALQEAGIPYLLVEGDVAQRVQQAARYVSQAR